MFQTTDQEEMTGELLSDVIWREQRSQTSTAMLIPIHRMLAPNSLRNL